MFSIQGIPVPRGARVGLIDMDGTATRCTDTINFEATGRVLATRGIVLTDLLYAPARGRSREQGIQEILMKCGREDLLPRVAEIAEEKNVVASRLRKNLTPAAVPPKDRRVLKQLRRCGLLLAIGTTSRNGLDTLNRVQLTSYFDVIVTGNEAAEKIQIWSLALRYFNARPDHAIVIEDAQTGIDAAVAMGVRFSVGVGCNDLQATVQVPELGAVRIQRT